jgi:hypothetical protein
MQKEPAMSLTEALPPTVDRVRARTAPGLNHEIDLRTETNVSRAGGAGADRIGARIKELDHEWDIERALETNAGIVILTGLLLSRLHSRRWMALSAGAAGFLVSHALHGWCPPVSVFRRLKVRTASEIGEEMIALRLLRGDFRPTSDPSEALSQARRNSIR